MAKFSRDEGREECLNGEDTGSNRRLAFMCESGLCAWVGFDVRVCVPPFSRSFVGQF